jgi:hypothetical protein
MAVRELSGKDVDGTRLGQTSTDLIGFFGATPVVRFATSVQIPASTAAVSISATQWGFTTSTQANAIMSVAVMLATAFSNYGLTSSS